MRLANGRTGAILILLLAAAEPAYGGPLCADKPNLANPAATLGRVDYLSGGHPGSVAGGVLMIDIGVTVENNGAAVAPRSRLRYETKLLSPDGRTLETTQGVTDFFDIPAGGAERAPISIMVDDLAALLQPTGELAATVVIRVEADIDNEVDECDETDNVGEATLEVRTQPVIS